MGYELCISKSNVMSDDSESADIDWFTCGWDKLKLFSALLRLGERREYVFEDGGSCDYGVLPIDALSFVIDIERRLSADAMWLRYRRLCDIDESLADEWYDGLPINDRADMAITFFGDEVTHGDGRLDVMAFLYRESVEEYPWFVHGLADVLEEFSAEGVTELFVTGG